MSRACVSTGERGRPGRVACGLIDAGALRRMSPDVQNLSDHEQRLDGDEQHPREKVTNNRVGLTSVRHDPIYHTRVMRK
jgi:hypothetical protein